MTAGAESYDVRLQARAHGWLAGTERTGFALGASGRLSPQAPSSESDAVQGPRDLTYLAACPSTIIPSEPLFSQTT